MRDNSPTSTVGWSAVTAWHTPWTPAAGTLCRQAAAPTVGNERVFVCTASGAVGGTEPTWVVTKAGSTTDNSATWLEITGQPGVNGDLTNTPTWAQQKASSSSITASGMVLQDAAGDCLFVGTAATIGATEPTWNKTAGATTADNAVVWTSIGAPSNFGAWAAPHARLQNALNNAWYTTILARRITIYVGDDHTETQSAAMTISSSNLNYQISLLCVDHTVALPPGSNSLKTTASVTTTGANSISITENLATLFYWYGIAFTAGNGANVASLTFIGMHKLVNCSLTLGGTSASVANIIVGNTSYLDLVNTKITFGNTAQFISLTGACYLKWSNTSSALSGSVPTKLFGDTSTATPSVVILDSVDLSALTSTIFGLGSSENIWQATVINCQFNAAVTASVAARIPYQTVDVYSSDSVATNYVTQHYHYSGAMITHTTIVRTGGASNGVTPISLAITTTANANWIYPYENTPISIWNTVTASNVTVTLAGIWNSASLPNNDDIWMDVQYYGSSSAPLATFATGSKANLLATNAALTADTSAWDSLVTARANTTAYSVGNVIKLASNPGRIFFCTASTGSSAASEPVGYASAVDGGSVTDNNTTFRAARRFKLAITLSSPQPQLVGYLRAIVKAAVVSSTFYVDPLIVLS